jgi:hypothetical protein
VLRPIQDIIVFDTEYTPRRGAVPESICLAAQSVTTGPDVGVVARAARHPPVPPIPAGRAPPGRVNGFGDMAVWQTCGWPVVRFVDLALELTRLQNVDRAKGAPPHWWSRREALAHYGAPGFRAFGCTRLKRVCNG